jgi:HEAT repeat protein
MLARFDLKDFLWRWERLSILSLAAFSVLLACVEKKGGAGESDEFAPDELMVINDLCDRLRGSSNKNKKAEKKLTVQFGDGQGTASGDEAAAQDAARKLTVFGKRAVPQVAEILRDSDDPRVRLRAAWVLSMMRHESAGKALLPILQDEKNSAELRALAAQGVGACSLDEAVPTLCVLARAAEDENLKLAAFLALRTMPKAWTTQPQLFVDALADPREEVRLAAAKICLFAKWPQARGKLVAILERDDSLPVRMNAIAALSAQRAEEAVPVLVRISSDANAPAELAGQAVRALSHITGVVLKTPEQVQTWWEKYGRLRFPEAKQTEAPKNETAPDALKSAPPAEKTTQSLRNPTP